MAKFDVPEGKFQRIGDVAQMLNVKTSVIRFWETQFPQLKPKKTRSGQRMYSPEDVELLCAIHRELKETGMTIEGLKRKMRQGQSMGKGSPADRIMLQQIRKELQLILDMLKRDE